MRRGVAVPAWAALVGLVGISTALRWWAASKVPTPWIVPDEVVYAELGRSLFSSGSFEILGDPVRFYSLVYPALVGLPLSLGDRELGYELLKPLQAFVMSLAAVPVYLWGRSLMSKGWALVAAGLTLAVPGLAYSGLVMTEVAFYPLATLAAWAAARALAASSLLNQALAVAAILLASATRLQGVVLAPVFFTALVFMAIFERSTRPILRSWPALGGLCLAGVGWTAWRLVEGPASELLGAYRAAAEVGYTVSDAVLYSRWHLSDVLLMTGVVPACALAVLAVSAFAGKERSAEARAYLALATALVAWLVVEVGIFASRHVGRLAERDLLAVCPVLFLGLALWLHRGAPRPRIVTTVVGAAALGLVLTLPVGKLVSHAAIPDAFTLIPLQRLQARRPDVDLQLVVDLLAAGAILAFALVPRRSLLALPLAIGLFLAATSVHAGRVVAAEATIVRRTTLPDDRRWIDEAANGPVTYLYGGERYWNAVLESIFWNRKVERVHTLPATRVPGLADAQQTSVGPLGDGRLVHSDGSPLRERQIVASSSVDLKGQRIERLALPSLVLWRVAQPPRLKSWVQEVRDRDGLHRFLLFVYACGPGTFRSVLSSPVRQRVRLTRNLRTYRTLTLEAGERRRVSIPARPTAPAGKGMCSFGVRPEARVEIEGVAVRPQAVESRGGDVPHGGRPQPRVPSRG